MDDSAPVRGENQEDVQNTESHRENDVEVEGDKIPNVVPEERNPGR
jgi:hypothetical protein